MHRPARRCKGQSDARMRTHPRSDALGEGTQRQAPDGGDQRDRQRHRRVGRQAPVAGRIDEEREEGRMNTMAFGFSTVINSARRR